MFVPHPMSFFVVLFLFVLVFLCHNRPKSKHVFWPKSKKTRIGVSRIRLSRIGQSNGPNSNKPAGLSRIGLSRARPLLTGLSLFEESNNAPLLLPTSLLELQTESMLTKCFLSLVVQIVLQFHLFR